ncbi:uncharacterized protein LOC143449170 isoform X2 [Clavelina lepadiformis]|uniref:uncharacterized protein LOC143449170 isoform X2 n=1 Tax=Clavelina lepadiformis TaxID=159417 RepID=UPI0040420A6C
MSFRSDNIVSLGRVVQASEVYKRSLFKYASEGKAKKISQWFSTETGLDLDVCNKKGQTALYTSCLAGHNKCVFILLEHGANPNRRCNDGSTPMHAAAFSCSTSLVKMLVEYGGDLRLHDYQDLLPRDWAEEAGSKRNKKVLELLDNWQELLLDTILPSTLHMNSGKISTMNVSRLGGRHIYSAASANTVFPSRKFDVSQQRGYGNFLTMSTFEYNAVRQNCSNSIGYSTCLPIVSRSSLTTLDTEPGILCQAPPYFVLMNGCWGSQRITVKKAKKLRRNIPRQMASTADLLIAELEVYKVVRHRSILILMGVCIEQWENTQEKDIDFKFLSPLSPQCFLFERVYIGSVYHSLHENSCGLSIADASKFLIQIEDALSYLHQLRLIHCCITSHAVMIVSSCSAKLSDFCYTTSIGQQSKQNHISPVFNRWLAPEILVGKKPAFESDMYSFCVVACEMLSGVLPWRGYDPESIRHQIVTKGQAFVIPAQVPSCLHPVLSIGLALSRTKRTVQLKDIARILQCLCKSDDALHSNIDVNKNVPGIGRCNGDMGIDVPDAVAFHSYQPENAHCLDKLSRLSYSGRIQRNHPTYSETPNCSNMNSQAVLNNPMFQCSHHANTSSLLVKSPVPSSRLNQSSLGFEKSCDIFSKGYTQRDSRLGHCIRKVPSHSISNDCLDIIHPELQDTDSRNSSVTELTYAHISQKDLQTHGDQQNIFINGEIDVIPNLKLADGKSDALATLKSSMNQTFSVCDPSDVPNLTIEKPGMEMNVGRSSPYPDLDKCKASLGNYILCGLENDDENRKLQGNLAREKSTISLTSSYLNEVYPVSSVTALDAPPLYNDACNSANRQPQVSPSCPPSRRQNVSRASKSFGYKDRERNISQGSLPPRACSKNKIPNSAGAALHHRLSAEDVRSPSHTSWQKVHDSVVEMSMIFEPSSTQVAIADISLQQNKCDRSQPDVVSSRNSSCVNDNYWSQQHSECLSSSNLFSETSFTANTSSFFNEVISATGMGDIVSTEFDFKHTGKGDVSKLANKKIVSNITASKTQHKSALHRRKTEINKDLALDQQNTNFKYEVGREVGLLKSKHRAPTMKEVRAESKNGNADNVCILYSNFERIPDVIEVEVHGCNENQKCNLQHASCQTSNTTNYGGHISSSDDVSYKEVETFSNATPYPSAESQSRGKSPDLEELFSQFACRRSFQPICEKEVSSRRFSIASEELEDIFADFASRQCSDEPNERKPVCNRDLVHDGIDVPDGTKHDEYIACKPQNNSKKYISHSKLLVSRSCQTVSQYERSTSAIDPPSIDDFLQKTGDWSLVFSCGGSQLPAASNSIIDRSNKSHAKTEALESRDSKEAKHSLKENVYDVSENSDMATMKSQYETCLEVSDASVHLDQVVNNIDGSKIRNENSPIEIVEPLESCWEPKKQTSADPASEFPQSCEQLTDDNVKPVRLVLPASHMQPIKTYKAMNCKSLSGLVSPLISPRPGLENLSSAKCASEPDNNPETKSNKEKLDNNSFTLTPSKLSFHKKLSLFESRFAEKCEKNTGIVSDLISKRRQSPFEQAIEARLVQTLQQSESSVNAIQNDIKCDNEDEITKQLIKSETSDLNEPSRISDSNGYTTALDEGYNLTPANANYHLSKIKEKGVKTSTPVIQRGLVLQQSSSTGVFCNRDSSPKDARDVSAIENKCPVDIKIVDPIHLTFNDNTERDGKVLLDTTSKSDTKNSPGTISFLHISSIPRCQGLPDISSESNLSACLGSNDLIQKGVQSTRAVISSSLEHITQPHCAEGDVAPKELAAAKRPTNLQYEPSYTNFCTKMPQQLDDGISALADKLTDDVLASESIYTKQETLRIGDDCNGSSASYNFSGISYDETDVNKREKNAHCYGIDHNTAKKANQNNLNHLEDCASASNLSEVDVANDEEFCDDKSDESSAMSDKSRKEGC